MASFEEINKYLSDNIREVNGRIDEYEAERLQYFVDALYSMLDAAPREWDPREEDNLQVDMAAIQIYYKNIFIEMRYIIPVGDSISEYLDVQFFYKGVEECFSLIHNKLEIYEEFFMQKLFEIIDRGIARLKYNRILEG